MCETAAYRPRISDVTFERLDGEVIAVHLGTGCYFSMLGSAADMWWLLGQATPIERWATALERVYPAGSVDPASFGAFIDSCIRADIIVPAEPAAHEPEEFPNDFARAEWSVPVLEEFTDLRDLILVDPVHDTTEQGWPHTEPDPANGNAGIVD